MINLIKHQTPCLCGFHFVHNKIYYRKHLVFYSGTMNTDEEVRVYIANPVLIEHYCPCQDPTQKVSKTLNYALSYILIFEFSF